MRTIRLLAVAAVGVAAALATPVAAQAAVTQSFYADSGDSCRYGVADGTLSWRYATTSPVPVVAVGISGKLTDRPTPTDPSTACLNDGYLSTVTFTAYTNTSETARYTASADNAVVPLSALLGGTSTTTSISRLVVQVCRRPVITLPPSYCGAAVTYLPPPLG